MYKRWLIIVLLALCAGLLILPTGQAQVTQPINLGSVRVINALVGLGEVDIYLNQRVIHMALAPEQATPYVNVPIGRHNVAVRAAGASQFSIPIADILIDLGANQSQTAIVYQKLFATEAFTPPVEQIGGILLLDDDRSPIELGKARLTAAHLAPGTPGKLSIAYPSRASLLHEISFEQPYGTIDIDADVYPLTIVDAESPTLDRLEQSGELVFNANTSYTLVMVPDISPNRSAPTDPMSVGFLSNSPRLFAISTPLDPPADGIQLRIIHAAHNTAVLDLYIDERLVVPRMNYGQYTEYLPLENYSHMITLRSRDAAPDAQPYATANFSINAQNRAQKTWTIMLLNANNSTVRTLPTVPTVEPRPAQEIVNLPNGQLLMTLLPDNIAQTQNETARVRLLHAIDGALELSLQTAQLPPPPLLPGQEQPTATPGSTPTPAPALPLVEPVVYGAEANEVETRIGLYRELNFLAGTSAEILTLENQFFTEGMVYTYVLIGLPAGEPPVQALLLADFGRGIPSERLYQGRITTTNSPVINVRRQASTNAGIVGTVANDSVVEVFGRNADAQWVYIGYSDAVSGLQTQGWVSASLIRVTRLGEQINILSLPLVQA